MMKAVVATKAGAPFEFVERAVPEPAAGEVLIKVEACGICRGDRATKDARHGVTLPRIPGHEVAGTVAKHGSSPTRFKLGQRVGVGWRAGGCGRCDACRAGNFGACRNQLTTGQSVDGGYAEYMIAREEAVVAIPDGISAAEAAPLLCAGRTTFSALRSSGAAKGDLVAIHGIGGLGHLAIQFAARLGCHVAALSRGTDKEALARSLGAEFYIDTNAVDAAAELKALGGARVLLCTAPNAKETSSLIGGIARNGRMVVVASTTEPIEVPSQALIGGGVVISGAGWTSIGDALRFSNENGVRPMIETFPLAQAATAFDKMMNSTVHFRAVLTMNGSAAS
jgi:D-arabinose 1-dehydrogenase-like Zn-dependent alcohol dehydrogenase